MQAVLTKFKAVYTPTANQAGLPALVAASAELDRLAGQIEQTARRQQARNGASLEKAAALQALGDAAYRVASAVQACASASGNLALAGQVDFARAEIVRGADKSLLSRAESLHETATAVVDALHDYGVTSETLDDLEEKIEAFRTVHALPRQRVNEGSTATKALKKLFKQTSVLLRDRVDRLMVPFKATHPEFHDEYRAARALVGPAVPVAPEDGADANTAPMTLPKAA